MSAWCCERFDFLVEQAGEKGCSVIATDEYDRQCFQLIARPFEKDVLDEVKTALSNYSPDHTTKSGKPISIAIAMFSPLVYCPNCGKKLSKLIRKHKDEFDKLVKEHLKYSPCGTRRTTNGEF